MRTHHDAVNLCSLVQCSAEHQAPGTQLNKDPVVFRYLSLLRAATAYVV
ncbi:hypothetical protein [Oceanisphaera sp. W20_SRM_FM3]